ncbi:MULTISPECIES: translation elongation factor Ts [Azorhizobium]|uniref:Elongation factor Ts n=1 Tax=Azorhizobium caulinodans (strain ATCC 43989 / DSM 5975 / JCM 20966 / LMG 6465 / NBRC 14845 / NCIMB 13405 / ORS 571) TaxID=438753 RepID=EFTS_AZOC5|nr:MULTISPECIES: translation elongation factor Ts [Azorhizobium]A8I464.1 RecName: Full=Elongation factor Ts; Short=EF-Ts [Azorhizobium caulinodans ORS 571]TDT94708.1 elongation factor Ts [Azorhizobium sp. AG788]BAF87692.1 elongation factor Ts protein [Azorhizobium caulinodans ORS 571]
MAAITAGLVKELRDKTGAGMMDCKAALTENNGDIEAAIDWLRKKGLAKAAKKAGRVAAEGLVAVESSGHYAAAIEVNAETDFVARNADFQAFVREAAKVALNTDGSIEAVAAAHFPGESVTVADKLATLIATIGENMTLRRSVRLTVSAGVIATYVHGAVSEGQGRIGVLVALESQGDVEKLSTLGRQIAMHVAALNPLALDASGIDEATIAREKAILLEKHQGKPANVQEKIAESGMKTYFKEVTLLEQPFVHDGSKSVAQVLKENEGSVGAPITLKGFVRYALGEGIEKEESDFAAEVAAAAGQS